MAWLTGWPHGKAIPIALATGAGTNYQVKVTVHSGAGSDAPGVVYLNSYCTDFPNDIRFTDNDGETELSHWSKDLAADPVIFHVKVADDLDSNQSIYVYCGKSGATSAINGDDTFLFYDSFQKPGYFACNAAAAKSAGTPYMAENIVWDSVTEKWWWVYGVRNGAAIIKMMSSSTINGTYANEATVISDGSHFLDGPSLHKFNGTWYIYYGKHETTSPSSKASVCVQSSATVNSGYANEAEVIPHGTEVDDWDYNRATEPYCYKDGDTYYLFYMGQKTDAAGEEAVGYSSSSSPNSGFTKYGSNPVLSGTADEWDGLPLVADPFVFAKDGTIYLGYTGEGLGESVQWRVGLATITDSFTVFTKYANNPILSWGETGNWDSRFVFRGAVTEDSSVYYLPYCGGALADVTDAKLGLATLDLTATSQQPFLDDTKWAITNAVSQTSEIYHSSGAVEIASGNILHDCGSLQNVRLEGYFYDRKQDIALESAGIQWYSSANGRNIVGYRKDTSTTVYGWYYNSAWHLTSVSRIEDWHKVVAEFLAGGVKVYIDDNYLGQDATCTNIKELNPTTWTITDYFDLLFLRKYVDPEPVVGTAGSWEVEAFLLSITDSILVGDSRLRSMLAGLSLTDGLKSGDTNSPLGTMSREIIDGLVAGDSLSLLASLLASDGVKLGDSSLKSVLALLLRTDGLTAGDSRFLYGILSKLDGLKTGDTPSLLASLLASDGFKLGDTPLYNLLWFLTVADEIKFGDSSIINLILPLVVTDGAKLGDSLSILSQLIASEGIELGDTPLREVVANLLRLDGIKLGDTATLVGAILYLAIVVGLKAGDTNLAGMEADIQASDGMEAGDSPLAEMLASLAYIDGLEVGDSASQLASASLAATDGLEMGDSGLLEVLMSLSQTDGIELGDTPILTLLVYFLSIVDGVRLGDARAIRLLREILSMWLSTRTYHDVRVFTEPYHYVTLWTGGKG